jgi:hypothetical protein
MDFIAYFTFTQICIKNGILLNSEPPPPRRYPYFEVLVGFACSDDPERYAGDSVATGRVSHAGQVKGDDPAKKGYPGPPGWRLGVRLQPLTPLKYIRRGTSKTRNRTETTKTTLHEQGFTSGNVERAVCV